MNFCQHWQNLIFNSLINKSKQFERYFELLVEWNEKINLTAITEKNEVYLKHFYDSIAPILYGLITDQPVSILDIGAGAGFPSLPMKIIFPELKSDYHWILSISELIF